MAKNNEPEINKAPNMIVAGTTIKGDIESTSDILSDIGIRGTIEIKVYDSENNIVENANIRLNNFSGYTNNIGTLKINNSTLGIKI